VKRAIGLAPLTALELPHVELVSVAAEAGYDCIGLRLVPVAGQPYSHPLAAGAIERRLRDTGMRVLDVEVFRLEAATDVTGFEPALAAAQRLGASEILVHGADADVARLADTFAKLCELAARHNLNANLEPMPWVDVSSAATAKRILDAAGKDNAALLVDAIHFFRAGDRFADLSGARLRYAQLCDAPAERPADMQEIMRQARSDRLFPGEGGLDLKGLLATLPADLPLSLEVPVARKLPPLERARLALSATEKLLASL
jgi:sugar phosphate isomerase/epimerase